MSHSARSSTPTTTAGSTTVALTRITKRDGRVVDFDPKKIVAAIAHAGAETGEFAREEAARLAWAVAEELERIYDGHTTPTVEQVQDVVELTLMHSKWLKTAKAYILYREEHAQQRKAERPVPEEAKQLAQESKRYFRNQLAEFVYYSTYSKWMPDKGRRETWLETVQRYVDFMEEKIGSKLTSEEYSEIRSSMLKMEALGSMRLLWGAGTAARATNVCAYNCSFVAPSAWQDFGEIMYILMCGTGVGFSVERQTVEQLPIIKRQMGTT
ncbi:MAG: ATP cone domain-containing protein, partial [Candidatus Veblenbacteria bacterium]|nr:ATP cone domain-containing protein [Candidatus Veblenbacteria bacterium]